MIYIMVFFHSKNSLESLFYVSLYIIRHNIQHLVSMENHNYFSDFWVEIKTDKLESLIIVLFFFFKKIINKVKKVN